MQRALSALVMAVALAVPCGAATPGQPELTMTFEILPGGGAVKGVLTAPLTDNMQRELPADAAMDISVTRSAYSLGQSELQVQYFAGLAPGETVTFYDDISPRWEYNQQYTYMAQVTLPGYTFYTGYGNMRPGVAFNFEQNAFLLEPSADWKSVRLSAVVPHRDTDGLELTVDITSVVFYRAVDTSSWPYRYEELGSAVDFSPKETVYVIDDSPVQNATNHYMVRAITPYGYAEMSGSCYVGLDLPGAPMDVTAEKSADGALISWNAPENGLNWGYIDPETVTYNVYRCWSYGPTGRQLLAEGVSERSLTDTGAGLDAPLAVRYEVESVNERGVGKSAYSGYDYDIIVGPAYAMPFRETFDGGLDCEWHLASSSYYAQWYMATAGEYGSTPVTVNPKQGSGLIYVDYVYSKPPSGTTNTMTSYKIDMSGADNPYLSFWYYAIPDNDVTIAADCSADGGVSFGEPVVIRIADDTAEGAGWRQARMPLAGMKGSDAVVLRITTSYLDTPSSAIIDDVQVIDYPQVRGLTAEVDASAMSAVLTWSLPEDAPECVGFMGYIDGEETGEVASPWTVENLEYDHSYSFQVRPMYEDVEINASAPCVVVINSPAVTDFSVGDYDYTVLLMEVVPPVAYVSGYHGRGGLLRLPASVKFNDKEYSVQGVADAAFRGNASVESVTLPDGYSYVGREAFAGCGSLLAVSVPESLLTIGKRAFADCGALADVTFAGTQPPAVEADAFSGVAEGCKGHCPEGSAGKYAAVEALSHLDFGIAGIDAIAGGEDVVSVEWYDMAGRHLSAPASGRPCVARVRLADGRVLHRTVLPRH